MELGALDYEILFNESMAELTESSNCLSRAGEQFSSDIQLSTEDLQKYSLLQSRDPRVVRAKINDAVVHIREYTRKISDQIPIMEKYSGVMTSALIGSLSLSDDEFRGDKADLEQLLFTCNSLKDNNSGVISAVIGQCYSLSGIPRMTKEVNFAKREGVAALDRLRDVLMGFNLHIEEVKKVIVNRISQKDNG
jgi:hypothetical protein